MSVLYQAAHKSMHQFKYSRAFQLINGKTHRIHFLFSFFFHCRIDMSHAMATLSPLWILRRIICWCLAMRMPRTPFYDSGESWTHAMPAMTLP